MKKFVCKCGLWIVMLALAAGIFYLVWSMKKPEMEENGTLVKNMCRDLEDALRM